MEETAVHFRTIKCRSDSKVKKMVQRSYFDQLMDRMAEEPPARWNYLEEDKE
jgi:hypothetical protein